MSQDALAGIEGPLAEAVRFARLECRRLRHAEVSIAHLVLGALRAWSASAGPLFGSFEVTAADFARALRGALPAPDLMPTAADSGADDDDDAEGREDATSPRPAATVVEVVGEARALAGDAPVRLEHVLISVVRQPDNLPRRLLASLGVNLDEFEARAAAALAAAAAGKGGRTRRKVDGGRAAAAPGGRSAAPDSLLEQLAVDLVEEARQGRLDPVIGRERQVEQVLEILARRTKNNPVLVGEPGVGKSAIVEGLAQRLAAGQIPPRLQHLRIWQLHTAELVAGTQYRGDFEARILKLVEETAADPRVVLFIDEIHTILSAGGQPGTADAASLLKPHLARGDVRCIGATTTDEFRRFIEKDRALVRRFQPVNVPEPSPAECVRILEGLKGRYEEHHGVTIRPDALEAAVALSRRHLPERHLPDKALDLIDQTCARVVLRASKEAQDPSGAPRSVTGADVAELLREHLGKRLGEVNLDESARLLGIEEFLKTRVIGQDHVAQQVADRIRLARRELDFRPERPNGVFLFLGPTGVGKTEVARCLAEYLLGSRQALLRYDLSEFSEPHTVSRIVGSPPGYVGYDDEGHQLTSKIRSNPQAILLLDEIEKAHPSVLNLFLQVFEDGRLTDAQGRTVSFSEVTIVLTSNLGAEAFQHKDAIGFGKSDAAAPEVVRERAREILKGRLPPELLNRVDVVLVFNPLGREDIQAIAGSLVERAIERFSRDGREIEVTPEVVSFLGESGYDPAYGARHLQRNVETLLLQPLARETYSSDWDLVEKIRVARLGSALVFEKIHRWAGAKVGERARPWRTEAAGGTA